MGTEGAAVGKRKQAVAAAKLASELEPGTPLTSRRREVLSKWTSVAQWVGTPGGVDAVDRIEDAWPGYTATANASILNAYYTDPDVVSAVWDWLRENGVGSGHAFEPGCGRGDWMRHAPRAVTFDAVDIDPISVRVAGLLTGRNVVESRLERWDLGSSSRPEVHGYDLVVGNVPFSSVKPGVNNPHRDNLHNLAVARSVDMLRPGGVVAVITSRYALDAHASRGWRERLAGEVDLVGAFRLPANTHREAGTAVVTDLLVLRRPLPGEQRPPADWLDTSTFQIGDDTFTHNAYWDAHPEHVLGRYEAGGAYRRENLNVIGDAPAHRLLARALAGVTVHYAPTGSAPQQVTPMVVTATGRRLPAGSIVVDATSATGFTRDGTPHPCPKNRRAELTALCQLRDRVLDYLAEPDEESRSELAALYDEYAHSFGALNRFELKIRKPGKDEDTDDDVIGEEVTHMKRVHPPTGKFRTDPSWWSVAAIEDFDEETMTGRPAAILQRPVIDTGPVWPDAADSLTAAVANSLARHHRLDVDYIAGQLGVDRVEAEGHLGAVAFELEAGEWELAATYLAGDVVGKLDTALANAVIDPRWERHVTALRSVLPAPLTQAEIVPELGVTWLTAQDVTEFVWSLTQNGSAKVMYHAPTGKWSSTGWAPAGPAQYRTGRYNLLEQVVRACNATPTTVMVTVEVGHKEVKRPDPEATAQEQFVRDNLNEALQQWCWADGERAGRLADRYNRLYNRYQPVAYDGAHLTLPGVAADFTPRPHQKDAVWRILTTLDTGTLLAHGVGAGKTAAMIIAAHEARRTGRVHGTSMFAVPGNMVEQFARDYLRLYPQARVLSPRDTDKDGVREFAARAATGDFDAVVCSHNVLKAIPLHPDTQAAQLRDRISELTGGDLAENLDRRGQRALQKRISKLNAQLTVLTEAAVDPDATYFDRIGVGMLFVDEAHLAKNIALATERKGLPMPDPSQLAEAVLARADIVRNANGPGAVVMATATPVTNSPAEMWVAARLVAPGATAKAGVSHFDAFAANFLSPVEGIEHDEKGDLKTVVRLAEYRNFPDLARMFRSFCDVRRTDSLGFALPVLDSGRPHVHLTPPSHDQRTVADWARERATGKHLDLPDGVKDPVIAILGTARAAALHPATVSPETRAKWATTGHQDLYFDWHAPVPKLVEAADTIARIHHDTAGSMFTGSTVAGAAQVVFCDGGVPNGAGPSVYSVLTDALVARGVRRDQIAWVHDYPDVGARQPLWDAVRSGRVRVLLGSTMQMGVGVNIQTRLYAAHELTVPYRPDWLEQAEGRLVRQGNHHTRVEIHRYVSERTADATSWQILERKARFIHTAMSHPDTLTRDLRDDSTETPAEQFAQISALATGDQRHIELAAITGNITRLERAERAHKAARTNQARSISQAHTTIAGFDAQLATLAGLQPVTDGDTATLGQTLLAVRANTTLDIAGVTVAAQRDYYELSLSIPGTRLRLSIARDRLDPADGGRGLGIRLNNWLASIPAHTAEIRQLRDNTQRQLDAELERPVDDDFARAGELDELRRRQRELREALHPTNTTTTFDAVAGADVEVVPEPVGHPIWGERMPTLQEQRTYVAAFHYFGADQPAQWGNRANDDRSWGAAATDAVALVANHQPGRVIELGRVRGVPIAARIEHHTVHLFVLTRPATPGAPTYDTLIGRPIDTADVAEWVTRQRQQARIHANTLRHGVDPARPPTIVVDPARFER